MWASKAELARSLGISRARVSQVLELLDMAPEVVEAITNLGHPLPSPIISERALRPLVHLPVEEQKQWLQKLLLRKTQILEHGEGT